MPMSSTGTTGAGPEQAAVRKVIYSLAELTGEEMDPHETPVLEAASVALDNVEAMQQQLLELEARVDDLEDRAPRPEKKRYDRMDKADKVTVLKQKLRETAEATNGRAAMTYDDVIRAFDGEPSPGQAYDLMEAADSHDGYTYEEAPDGTKRVTHSVNA